MKVKLDPKFALNNLRIPVEILPLGDSYGRDGGIVGDLRIDRGGVALAPQILRLQLFGREWRRHCGLKRDEIDAFTLWTRTSHP